MIPTPDQTLIIVSEPDVNRLKEQNRAMWTALCYLRNLLHDPGFDQHNAIVYIDDLLRKSK